MIKIIKMFVTTMWSLYGVQDIPGVRKGNTFFPMMGKDELNVGSQVFASRKEAFEHILPHLAAKIHTMSHELDFYNKLLQEAQEEGCTMPLQGNRVWAWMMLALGYPVAWKQPTVHGVYKMFNGRVKYAPGHKLAGNPHPPYEELDKVNFHNRERNNHLEGENPLFLEGWVVCSEYHHD
jgi:hypothetical protein